MYSDLYAQGRWAWRPPAPYPEEIQEKQRLVFVVGSGRSGTTLLRTMLGGHPALFAPPELNLLPFDSMGAARDELNRLGIYGLRYGLIQTIAHLEQLSMEEATARVKELEDQDVPIPAAYRLLEERSGNRRLVDKSPIYAFHEAWLQRAEQIFDRPNYLFIFRHPYAVIDSIVRRRYSRLLPNLWGVWDENPWLYAEKIWAVLNWNVITFLKSIPAERQYHIPYEKLVTDKQGQLQAICQSLNIDFDTALLDPYTGNRMMSGVGDIYMKKRGRVDANLADAWRKQRPPQRLSDFTRQVAAHLGYEESP